MSKRNSNRPPYRERREMPKIENSKDGGKVLMCPFCNPSHPIMPFIPSPCGTVVEVTAVQLVFRAKYAKDMICAKCGQGGGEMVVWNEAFIHTHDCTPGTATLLVEPKYSKIAKAVFGLSDGKIKTLIQNILGEAKEVAEAKPDGKRTGKILGYFFYRQPKAQ